MLSGRSDHLIRGIGRLTELADGVADLERLGALQRQVEHQGDGPIRLDLRLLRLADLELGQLQLGADGQDVGLLDHARSANSCSFRDEELADTRHIGLAELDGQGRGDGVDVDRVEVVDLVADGVLELGLGDPLGHRGAERVRACRLKLTSSG